MFDSVDSHPANLPKGMFLPNGGRFSGAVPLHPS
jgi:hypothetical protein